MNEFESLSRGEFVKKYNADGEIEQVDQVLLLLEQVASGTRTARNAFLNIAYGAIMGVMALDKDINEIATDVAAVAEETK